MTVLFSTLKLLFFQVQHMFKGVKKMKLGLIISLMMTLVNTNVSAVPFQGKSYIVMEASHQIVIEGSNQDYIQSVASISKIMTCIIAIENMELDTIITVDDTINKAWGSGVYIHIGDKISLRDLLYGLMLRSGNDAAVMIAKAVGKEIPKFVDMMNDKAKELQLHSTTFSNPTGLDEEDNGNQSTVYDMARLMAYCHQNPIFNEIVSTKEYKREDGNGTWHNKNKLLTNYEYCIGGKTGFTKKARRTLITMARKDDLDLIIVTFNCGNDFEFHQKKFEECYANLKATKIFSKGIVEFKQQQYYLDFDVYVNKKPTDKVEVSLNNNEIVILLNNQPIAKQKVVPYNCFLGFKMVLKDLFYG